jgi:signal transduction histidine kinase
LAEEKERRRIAQILHDELQQLLFGIQLRVKSMIKSARAAEVPVLVEDAEQASQWLQDAIEKTRGLSLDLSPPLLEEDEDFESTLKWLGRRMREVASLDVEIRVTPRLPHIAAETRVRLFQIVRELLFNVAKHAATEHVKIRVRARKDELSLVIADDGVGFDVAAAMATRKTGLGLFSIRDRIGFYGGRIAIRSNPRRGTVVRLSIPLE